MMEHLFPSVILLTTFIHAADKPAVSIPGLKQDIEFAKVGDVLLRLDAFAP